MQLDGGGGSPGGGTVDMLPGSSFSFTRWREVGDACGEGYTIVSVRDTTELRT